VARAARRATLVLVSEPSTSEPPAPFAVAAVDVASADESTSGRREAAAVLERAVGPDHADDRFEPHDRTSDGSVLVLARHGDEAMAYVAAGSSRGRFQLDVVADAERIAELADGTANAETTLESLMVSMIDRATRIFDHRSSLPSADLEFELWGRPRQDWHDRLAERLGLRPVRSLHQMRCPLPVPARPDEEDRTRPIEPDLDTRRLLEVNNRAFAYHPDQSDQRLSDLESGFRAPSFQPESVRILDADPDDPRAIEHPMVGFCWTKIHGERPGRVALGEIYVIAVDPAYHGEGHGTGLTTAGLRWLADQGLATGMLYVESDNEAAIATYRKLGFTVHGTYTAWRRP